MKTIVRFTTLICLSIFMANHVYAFRCANGNLVLAGDSSLEVLVRCGQPAAKEFVGRVRTNGRYVNVDRYLYIPPRGQFLRIVEFHDGEVKEIVLGKRVQ